MIEPTLRRPPTRTMSFGEQIAASKNARRRWDEALAAWDRIGPKKCRMCGAAPRSCGAECPFKIADAHQQDADERWFLRHRLDERIRPTTWAERVGTFVRTGIVLDDYVRLSYWGNRRRDGSISVGWVWTYDVRPEEIA
ncbi:hypothetical protein [Nocardioides aurantiacus]|uniref:hypothetical protein n=1 Tax=Nocardioides aurantiacus TaxID=86796 RepID=UPI000F497022|nr:hypothetical protein [Nocardioides aurantiacus]